MIKITNHRTRGGEAPFEPVTSSRSIEEALELLILHEIGWSGKILLLEPDRVTVQTTVMNCVDTTLFEGSEDEMGLLVEAAGLSLLADPRLVGGSYLDRAIDSVMRITKGKPLLVKLASGMILGAPRAKIVLLSMIGEEGLRPGLLDLNMETLLSVMTLIRIDKASADEAIRLATSTPIFDAQGRIQGLKEAA